MGEWFSWAPLLAAAISLAFLAALTMSDQRQRKRDWRRHPERLIDLPPRNLIHVVLCAAALLAGLAAIVWPSVQSPALVTALAALVCAGAGHRQRWTLLGGCALGLAAACVIEAAMHYLKGGPTGLALGAALAAAWMFWLSRFWSRQLDERRPWTTAGRLIPAARIVASLAAIIGIIALWVAFAR